MKIEISTEFETSHVGDYRTRIVARILNNQGVVLCEGEDADSWPRGSERRASAKEATRVALDKFERMLNNAREVAKLSGLG